MTDAGRVAERPTMTPEEIIRHRIIHLTCPFCPATFAGVMEALAHRCPTFWYWEHDGAKLIAMATAKD